MWCHINRVESVLLYFEIKIVLGCFIKRYKLKIHIFKLNHTPKISKLVLSAWLVIKFINATAYLTHDI